MIKRVHVLLLLLIITLFCCEPVVQDTREDAVPPAVGAANLDLMGLAINANYDDQRPSSGELNELCVKWVRSIRYQSQFSPHTTDVNWLVIINQETIPWCRNAGIPPG
jgi:hypothetical protein